MAVIDMVGQRYRTYTVWAMYNSGNKSQTKWICRCDCGSFRAISRTRLLSGKICCHCQKSKAHELRDIWYAMHHRCNNPKATHYRYYGGRGICVCERWSSFENFLEDMGERPKGFSIDRIDIDKGYSPENCRWVDIETQASNTRRNNYLTWEGKTMTITQWARHLGITAPALRGRIKRGCQGEELFKKGRWDSFAMMKRREAESMARGTVA